MATVTAPAPAAQPTPPIVFATMVWQLIVAVGSVIAALQFFEVGLPDALSFYEPENFYNLGDPVQYFVGLICLMPAAIALYSNWALLQNDNSGRYAAFGLNLTGAILGVAYLLNLWDFYIGMDSYSNAILDNLIFTYAIAAGYAIYWFAGRFDEESAVRERLEIVGAGIGMLSLIALLLAGGFLGVLSDTIGTYSNVDTIITTIAIAIFASIAIGMLNQGEYFGESTGQREAWQGWLMLTPNMVGFAIFFAGPLILSFYLSFTNAAVGQVPEVIGLDNYIELVRLEFTTTDPDTASIDALSDGYREVTRFGLGGSDLVVGGTDPLFWISLYNTLLFCLMLVPLSTIPALILATVLNAKIPGVKFFRAVYFLPSVAAVVGTALIWRWLYNPINGYYNYIISEVAGFLGFADPNIEWLTQESTALPAVVLLAAWQVVGFNTVLFLAGLQGIPKILYEAAYVDGASNVQQFFRITLPMLAPTTFFVVITTVIQGLQVFNEIFTMFPARPVPEHVITSVYYLYDRGFFRFQFGYASSVAWLLFALIFAITLFQFRLSRSAAYED